MAGGGNAIRGSRVGAGPMGEAERGEAAPRQAVTYFCSHEHRSVVTFAVEAAVPDSWDCPRCGLPASLDSENPPPAPKIEPYKTHLAYVKERRSDAEAEDDPRRGPRAPALPPEVRRHHLLAARAGAYAEAAWRPGDRLGADSAACARSRRAAGGIPTARHAPGRGQPRSAGRGSRRGAGSPPRPGRIRATPRLEASARISAIGGIQSARRSVPRRDRLGTRVETPLPRSRHRVPGASCPTGQDRR